MAGKSLSELTELLKDEPIPVMNVEDLPDFGSWAQPPQPGPYRFKLPASLATAFEIYEDKGKQYIRALFDKDAPLLIVNDPRQKHTNEAFQTRLTNQRRKRGEIEASDLDYLLKALGETTTPTSNRAYMETLQKHAAQEFTADITYNWTCSDTRDIYVDDGAGGTKKDESGRKGCGKKYYQAEKTKKPEQQIQKVNGEYPYEIACTCGAVVRAFANIDNMRK
jgi:hypothetical protein